MSQVAAINSQFKMGNDLTIFVVVTINPLGGPIKWDKFPFTHETVIRLAIPFRDPRWKMDCKAVLLHFEAEYFKTWMHNPKGLAEARIKHSDPYHWRISTPLLLGVSGITYETARSNFSQVTTTGRRDWTLFCYFLLHLPCADFRYSGPMN